MKISDLPPRLKELVLKRITNNSDKLETAFSWGNTPEGREAGRKIPMLDW